MVFEYILKNHNIDPASDLEIDQSIDFGSTAAAFTGDMSADFTVEFEPSATALEKEGKGYVVAWAWIPAMSPIPLTVQRPAFLTKTHRLSRASQTPFKKAWTMYKAIPLRKLRR